MEDYYKSPNYLLFSSIHGIKWDGTKVYTFWTTKKDTAEFINNSNIKTWNMAWPYGPDIVANWLHEEPIITLSFSAHAHQEHPHKDSGLDLMATWHLQKFERLTVCTVFSFQLRSLLEDKPLTFHWRAVESDNHVTGVPT